MKRIILFLLLTAIVFQLKAQENRPAKSVADSIIAFYVEKVNPDTIESYMQALEDFVTRFCLADNRREVSVWIKNKFIELGYPDTRLDSFQLNRHYNGIYYQTWQYNVVSTFQGYARPDEIYILGGHHDAIVTLPANAFLFAPGADDNASGVAAALETARVMKQYGYAPEATIKFITFAAEELGLHGSWHYANNAAAQGMDIKLMINNDMISNSTKPEDQWLVKIFKYQGSEWVANLAASIIQNHTMLDYLHFYHNSPNTDSWPFYANGYSAVFFHEDEFSPYYHSYNDLVVNTNKYYAAEVTKVSLGMLIHENGPGVNTGIAEKEQGQFARLNPNYPNPFSGQTTLSYALNRPGWLTIRVFDHSGRVVSIIHDGWHEAGSHRAVFDAQGLPRGIYYCQLQTNNQTSAIKLVAR